MGKKPKKLTGLELQLTQTIGALRNIYSRTQTSFATALGIDQSGYSQIERGYRKLSIQNIEQIGMEIGLSSMEIFSIVEFSYSECLIDLAPAATWIKLWFVIQGKKSGSIVFDNKEFEAILKSIENTFLIFPR